MGLCVGSPQFFYLKQASQDLKFREKQESANWHGFRFAERTDYTGTLGTFLVYRSLKSPRERGVPMDMQRDWWKELDDKKKLAFSCHQVLSIEPLCDL